MAALLTGSSPANAAVGDFTCTTSAQITHSPGLLLQPRMQHQTFDVGYSNCVSTSQPTITSGTRSGSTDAVSSCLDLPYTGPATNTITWNTGQSSTFVGTMTLQFIAGQTVFTWTGTITSGLFTGAGFTEVLSQNSLNLLACAIPPGVTSQTGVGTLISS
ncbi:hypothetical protein [Streptomyces sp. NPDC020965]|uniref:hypothetical protein n=1 Tax=Streptomyces sp. NPDC020965 TaxID=3365105 RepID=UPI0037950F75